MKQRKPTLSQAVEDWCVSPSKQVEGERGENGGDWREWWNNDEDECNGGGTNESVTVRG